MATACDAPGVSMVLDVPAAAQPETSWIEVGAFPNGCPPPSMLAGGLPPSGLAARVAYAADASAVGLGKLDTARYGFAAVARRDDCGVLAAGCTNVDVSQARAIEISLDTTSDPDASACSSGLVCTAARCLPPSNGDPNVGAGCSMVLVGAGPLPEAMSGGPFVTAPAIVPLAAGGFLVAYMEYLEADGTTQVTVQPLDEGGAALQPTTQALSGYCPGQTKIDAAALAMGPAGGLVVTSHAPCTEQSGYELFPLDPLGNPSPSIFANVSPQTILLSTHALTPAAAANRFLLASNANGSAVLSSANGSGVTPQASGFGTPQDTSARVVRTSAITAVEVDGPSVGDAGISGVVGRVYLASGDPTSLGGVVDQVPASVTALTALGNRAFLLTNGAGKGEDVAFRGYDLGASTQPAISGGFGAAKATTVLSLDAAAAQGRLFCALEQQDSVSIAVFDGASTTSPQLLQRVDLAADVRIPRSAHDGPIAIAASSTRVAIAWVAHRDALADGDTLGGYAVFACRQ